MPPLDGLLRRADALLDRLGGFPPSLRLLMARVAVAAVFWKSGLTKIASWQQTVALFAEEYRVPVLAPELAAWLAAAVELTAPALLVLGLAARLGALSLLGVTAVIQIFVYPESWPEHLLWAALLTMIVTEGPGRLSLDHLLRTCLLGRRR
ncbi:MAG: DoxX family protein [Alphaproteobacteria bacterium]|nr:DoxX family protein [Alphaproteobacteria bacterium]